MKIVFKFKLKTTIFLNDKKISLKKKNHPQHKYSVTFVMKVGTIKIYYTGVLVFLSIKLNKTARIRANYSMLRLLFEVYGAVITLKKLNAKKKRFF